MLKGKTIEEQHQIILAERNRRSNMYRANKLATIGDLNITQAYLACSEAKIDIKNAKAARDDVKLKKAISRLHAMIQTLNKLQD